MSDQLSWFVDRLKQLHGFLKMARGETDKRVMVICAPIGMGKTWLIHRMRQESQQMGLPTLHVDFRDRRAWDYLMLVRAARDQMGAVNFNALTQTINECTGVNVQLTLNAPAPGSIVIGAQGGSTAGNVTVNVAGDLVAGHVIKDNLFYVQADSPTVRQAIEVRITDAFFACLAQLASPQKRAVFLFDSYEEVTEEADRWLRDQLLARLRDGRLVNALAIIAGTRTPQLGPEWKPTLASTGLEPLTLDDVADYILNKRRLEGIDVATAFRMSGGLPGLLSQMADLAAVESGQDEDWL